MRSDPFKLRRVAIMVSHPAMSLASLRKRCRPGGEGKQSIKESWITEKASDTASLCCTVRLSSEECR